MPVSTSCMLPIPMLTDSVRLIEVQPVLTAVVRDRVRPEDLSKFVPAACGEVWSWSRDAKLPRPGRNVALYLDGGIVEAGAEISEACDGGERVVLSRLPAGRVATTAHLGPYAGLREAHAAVRRWCAEHGHRPTGVCWEIYAHWEASWNSDPSKIRTDVFHLLAGD